MVGNETSGHNQYVGIIVLAGQLCDVCIPAEGGTDALVLVEGHADAVAATADSDTGIALTALYGFGQGVGYIGIVATFG